MDVALIPRVWDYTCITHRLVKGVGFDEESIHSDQEIFPPEIGLLPTHMHHQTNTTNNLL